VGHTRAGAEAGARAGGWGQRRHRGLGGRHRGLSGRHRGLGGRHRGLGDRHRGLSDLHVTQIAGPATLAVALAALHLVTRSSVVECTTILAVAVRAGARDIAHITGPAIHTVALAAVGLVTGIGTVQGASVEAISVGARSSSLAGKLDLVRRASAWGPLNVSAALYRVHTELVMSPTCYFGVRSTLWIALAGSLSGIYGRVRYRIRILIALVRTAGRRRLAGVGVGTYAHIALRAALGSDGCSHVLGCR